jgi:cob(I)alamin adenosyltransferase
MIDSYKEALAKARKTLAQVNRQIHDLRIKAGSSDELILRADIYDQVDHLETRKRQLKRQIGSLRHSDQDGLDRASAEVERADEELRRQAREVRQKFPS